MKKNQTKLFIVVSTLIVAILILTVFNTYMSVNKKMKDYCFEELETTSKNLSNDLNSKIHTDTTMLYAMSEIIGHHGVGNTQETLSVMNSYSLKDSYISYVAILTPDHVMMRQDGKRIDVKNELSYSEEVAKGSYISEGHKGFFNINDLVIRNVVPIKEDNETIALLYGVISLKELANDFKTDIYDGKAYVYIEDGTSGDFLLDTWHKTLGNINDFKERQVSEGYNFEHSIEELQHGKSGDLSFVSKTINKNLYLHYEPLGINNWNIIVSIDEDSAFSKMNTISIDLYKMSIMVGIALFAYMLFVVVILSRTYQIMHRLDTEDQTTKLQNRNAYDAYIESQKNTVFEKIACIYIDVNGLHEINNKYGHDVGDNMLRLVANCLKKEFFEKTLYRIGGDEFVLLCSELDLEEIKTRMQRVEEQIILHKYSVSYGIQSFENELGLERVINEADQLMLENKRKYYQMNNRRRES